MHYLHFLFSQQQLETDNYHRRINYVSCERYVFLFTTIQFTVENSLPTYRTGDYNLRGSSVFVT